MNKTLISVIGPTAIGKTKLAISLAQEFRTEIISADSRQFFKEMRIGTAVPSQAELESAPHHFIQHISIMEAYSVGDFERDALHRIENLFKSKDIVVMVGGSGLYVDAVTNGLNSFPEVDPTIRKQLNQELELVGLIPLQEKLRVLDPEYFNIVDQQNPHRIIRAIEICLGTGKPYSYFINTPKETRPFNVISVGLTAERAIIYERIEKRVDTMLNEGLVDEVKTLKHFKELNALQTVGYKELFHYFDGNCSLDFAVSEIKKNTRRFAKRQVTWFKKAKNVHWYYFDYTIETIIMDIKNQLKINT